MNRFKWLGRGKRNTITEGKKIRNQNLQYIKLWNIYDSHLKLWVYLEYQTIGNILLSAELEKLVTICLPLKSKIMVFVRKMCSSEVLASHRTKMESWLFVFIYMRCHTGSKPLVWRFWNYLNSIGISLRWGCASGIG